MSPSESRLGEVLIERRLISVSQLDRALTVQQDAESYVPLGQVLIDLGFITRRQLHLLLEQTRKRPKLGEVLVRAGTIDAVQLEDALAQQRTLGLPLGATLVKLGYVSEEAMRQALCLQLNVPFLELDRVTPDARLARLVNPSYATRHRLVPVSRVGQTLTIAMDDPSDLSAIEDLGRSTGYMIQVVTSSLESIQQAIDHLYGLRPDMDKPADNLVLLSEENRPLSVANEYSQESRRADEMVHQLLALAIERRASDVHLEPLARNRLHIRFRIDGVLQQLDLGPLQKGCDENLSNVISRIKILGRLDIAERRRPQDGSFRLQAVREGDETLDFNFRVSVVPGYYGESVVVRVLDRRRAPGSVDKLGLSSSMSSKLKGLLARPSGIFLITGPTGSGKSTTLYAALMTIYRPEIRIVTAEDPIEYVYDEFSQSEVSERIGNTFANYLRAFLRHDPEVMMVGEIRDEETAEMAFRAAQTGHLLLSTLHTNDAVSAVTRLQDLGVEPTLISSSLIGVLSQRLIRTVCTNCKEPYTPNPTLLREFFQEVPTGFDWYRGRGCDRCESSGYRGRRVVGELWAPNDTDIILINKAAPMEDLRGSAASTTYSMAESALDLLREGQTNLEELIRMLPYSCVYRIRELVAPVSA